VQKFGSEERLKILGLTTLQDKREKSEMIELHTMLNRFTKVGMDKLFEIRVGVQVTSRNVYLNLHKHHTRLDIRKNFFTEREL
jgi:hypothetical protein